MIALSLKTNKHNVYVFQFVLISCKMNQNMSEKVYLTGFFLFISFCILFLFLYEFLQLLLEREECSKYKVTASQLSKKVCILKKKINNQPTYKWTMQSGALSLRSTLGGFKILIISKFC